MAADRTCTLNGGIKGSARGGGENGLHRAGDPMEKRRFARGIEHVAVNAMLNAALNAE